MKQYLLDTNALSEATKKRPDEGFMSWLLAVDENELFTSWLVLGEIQKGIDLISSDTKRKQLDGWLSKIIEDFDTRIIGLDEGVGLLWGKLMSQGQKAGKTPPVIDALIAAQCLRNDLTFVTRNIKDFEHFSNLEVFSPWHG